jgi:putative DNA primase/helicase
MATKETPLEVTIVDVPLTDDERRMLEAAEHVLTDEEIRAGNVRFLRRDADETAKQVADLKASLNAGFGDDYAAEREFKKALKQAASGIEFLLRTADEMLAESEGQEADELRAIRESIVETTSEIKELQAAAEASGIRVTHARPVHPLSDAGNAEHFAWKFGDLVRYDHARRRWLVWDRHHWRVDADAEVNRKALESVRERQRAASSPTLSDDDRKALWKWAFGTERFKARLDALIDVARTLKPIADDGTGWDETPGLLGVGNGVVYLRTGELRDGRPEDKITKCTGVEYDPAAECPQWLEFLGEVLEDDPDIVPYLQRLVGYSLTAEGTVHQLIFLMGSGANGKGTFLRALDHTLGEYASSISEQAFTDGRRNAHTTEVTDLESARFAYCEELGDEMLNADRLKDVSGGGHMIARRMRENTRTFRQTWQLWFTTNGTPRSDDNSLGWWRRVRAIDFPHSFTGEREDIKLDEKLQAEAPGILAWAVRGAVTFYESGIGDPPECVSEKIAEYRSSLDPLEALFQDGYLLRCDEEIWTPVHTLYLAYQAQPGLQPWIEQVFGKNLKTGGFRSKRHRVETSEGSQQLVGYHGVRAGVRAQQAQELPSWRFASDNSYIVEPSLCTQTSDG